ncbi:MAG TPA: hypothetical protein VMG81_05805 [Thermoplasmata archaeon]|nr:hypothetical protein [Thermoplasmata archaeon]
MTVPGPNGAAWAVELLVAAVAVATLGETLRGSAARWVPSWRTLEPVERGLTDLYLGGAAVYLAAVLPWGLFGLPALVVLVGLGLAVVAFRLVRDGRAALTRRLRAAEALLRRWPVAIALLSALALYILEVAVALPVGTGNTYDSSLLTTYTALLLRNGTTPTSFAPFASVGVLYPQGTTAWLGSAQAAFGLPAARTSLLVTPLFLALAPLGGFVLGRRWFRTDRAAAAVAIGFAWIGPGSRAMVGGSNDFVLAFPLVLLLFAQSARWVRAPPPGWGDLAAFGLLLGYSAALNPVGAEWVALALLCAGGLARPAFGGAPRAWLGRWAVTLALALVAIVPTLVVLARGLGSPGFVPGSAAPPNGGAPGISGAQFVGSIDPYLFRPSDVALAPIPLLRLELAVLLTVGLALLLVVGRQSPLGRYLETARVLLAGGIASIVLLLGLLWASSAGFGPGADFARLSSGAELSTWLFALYGLIAVLPLALALEAGSAPAAPAPEAARSPPVGRSSRWALDGRPGPRVSRSAVAAVVALAIVVPAVTLTATQLPPVLGDLYGDFGNVTAADFALLAYAGAHLPSGARVLVAPGSAAEFLPGYARDIVLLYPMVPGWPWINTSYRTIVRELTNGTLDAAGEAAMAALDVGYVAVTGNNTVLWPAFSPAPLLADPAGYAVQFAEGDAYLFERTGA